MVKDQRRLIGTLSFPNGDCIFGCFPVMRPETKPCLVAMELKDKTTTFKKYSDGREEEEI
jgi:hypothetical protein